MGAGLLGGSVFVRTDHFWMDCGKDPQSDSADDWAGMLSKAILRLLSCRDDGGGGKKGLADDNIGEDPAVCGPASAAGLAGIWKRICAFLSVVVPYCPGEIGFYGGNASSDAFTAIKAEIKQKQGRQREPLSALLLILLQVVRVLGRDASVLWGSCVASQNIRDYLAAALAAQSMGLYFHLLGGSKAIFLFLAGCFRVHIF